jgi:homoserine trans-succinylase
MKHIKTFENFNIRNYEDTPLYSLNRSIYLYYTKNNENFEYSSHEEFERDLLSKVSEIIPVSYSNNDDSIYNIKVDVKEIWKSSDDEVLGEVWIDDENGLSSYWINKNI